MLACMHTCMMHETVSCCENNSRCMHACCKNNSIYANFTAKICYFALWKYKVKSENLKNNFRFLKI